MTAATTAATIIMDSAAFRGGRSWTALTWWDGMELS
jgi:hypothetical protein